MHRGQNLQRLAAIAAQTFRYYTGWCDKPEGVINVVPGFGHTAGAALSGQPDVDEIAFTGATEVGKRILRAASGNLQKVSLELGGKAPNIVFADADIDAAVAGSAKAIFFNCDRFCVAGSRLYAGKKIRVGSGLDPQTQVGAGGVDNPVRTREPHDRGGPRRGCKGRDQRPAHEWWRLFHRADGARGRE